MELMYEPYQDSYHAELMQMIASLYEDEPECHVMTREKIENTISFMKSHADMGRIILLFAENQLAGYAIIVFSWSNEYGGIVLLIDELFIKPAFRNNRIGSSFIRYLMNSRPLKCVALLIEVMHNNKNALRLYQKLGFVPTNRNHLIYSIFD